MFLHTKRGLALLSLVLSALTVAFVFQSTTITLVNKWMKFDESYGHGWLVVGMVVYKLWENSEALDFKPPSKQLVMLVISAVVGLTLVHHFSELYKIQLFQQFSAYVIWVSLIPLFFSLDGVKKLFFPIAFFIFAIPIWDQLIPFLVTLTSSMVSFFLSFSNIVIFISENVIETPFGVLVIADSCSGLRYLIVALAIGAYAVHSEPLSFKDKVFFMAVSFLVGLVANWIRVYLLVLIAYQSEMQSELVNDHEIFGLIVFFICYASVFALLSYMRNNRSITADQR